MNVYIEKIQENIASQFQEFIGLSFNDIAYKIGINPELISSKLSIVTLVNKMLEYLKIEKKHLAVQLSPLLLSLKTIRLKENGIPKESMSFEQINFMNLVDEVWEDSHLRFKFKNTLFLFIVFQYRIIGNESILFFKGAKVWKMPQETLDSDVKNMWESTKSIVANGVQIIEEHKGNLVKLKNNLPGMSDNPVAHIRPKANDRNDTIGLPDGQSITKQAYWLNNKYIGKVVSDIPPLRISNLSSIETPNKYSAKEIQLLKGSLKESIYTIEAFTVLVSNVFTEFTVFDINKQLLDDIGYKVDKHFVISNTFKDINEYLESVIFKNAYFKVPDNSIFQDSFTKRKLENLENAFRLVKVEKNMYITDTCLYRANVQKEQFISYKKDVERFIKVNKFFTLSSLRSEGFKHELEELGFDDIFYESILKRPGLLKYLSISKQFLFIKTPYPVSNTHLMEKLIDKAPFIDIDKLIIEFNSRWKIEMNYEYAVIFAKSSDFYYSEELQKVFKSKEKYYNYIYNS